MTKPKTLNEVIDRLLWLQDHVLGIRLDRIGLQHRYGWSEATVDRRIYDGTFPKPIKFGGRNYWRLYDIILAEEAGQLPSPVSRELTPDSSSKSVPAGQAST